VREVLVAFLTIHLDETTQDDPCDTERYAVKNRAGQSSRSAPPHARHEALPVFADAGHAAEFNVPFGQANHGVEVSQIWEAKEE